MDWWIWPLLGVYLFLQIKAFGYIRAKHGTEGGSLLEAWGAWYFAPLYVPLMPFIWMNQWLQRRARANGKTETQIADLNSKAIGGTLIAVFALFAILPWVIKA